MTGNHFHFLLNEGRKEPETSNFPRISCNSKEGKVFDFCRENSGELTA